jgi:hypothetical protein
MKTQKTRLKQPQNGVKLGSKPTQEARGIKLGRSVEGEDAYKEKKLG